ncbi:MAG: hypothetical protein GYA42_00165 [Syntrophomonadaceae bacterium]|nr:hypothetical protein [Syntrophomonadaceae bacterium]
MSRDKITYLPLNLCRAGFKTRIRKKWTEVRESPANQINAVDRILISIIAALFLVTVVAQIYMACIR